MRIPQTQQNRRVLRERDVTALSRLALLLFCGVVLAAGFVLAAQQHFAAVQYGYQNENLRREREHLLAERQRLILERERVSSPERLEPAARQIGLRPATSKQIGSLKPNVQIASANASHATEKSSKSEKHR
jgi:cell division protein FtsL